jgi:excisionase family DNA binding protein
VSEPPRVDLSEPLLKPAEAARLIGVHHKTIYSWVASGRMPHLRFGERTIRFTREQLAEWAAQQEQGGRR